MSKESITRKHVGVDVSKDWLDAWKPTSRNKGSAHKRFANSGAGINALLRWIGRDSHIVVEATGGYEQLVVVMSHARGVRVSVVNPKNVRDMAKALGQKAKTDRLDAEAIVRYADIVMPEPAPKPTEAQKALASHVKQRENYVAARVDKTNSLGSETNAAMRTLIKGTIRHLEKAIAQIEKLMEAIVASCPKMTALRKELIKIPGIGPVTSVAMVAMLPQIGTLDRKEVASLCGMAPYARDSGKRKGKRSTMGGKEIMRRLGYMCARSIRRTRTALAAKYKEMVERGKPTNVALIAIARKLVIRANSVCKPFASMPYAQA